MILVFCPGGWDPAFVFAPVFSESVDRGPDDAAAFAGDLAYVDSERRPSVRGFLDSWGARTTFINGLQVPSVAHDVCTRWAMTGDAQARTDDWVSVVASQADPSLLMPNVHLSGPLFPIQYGTASVRVGLAGQLPGLLDGSALGRSDLVVQAPTAALDALEERYLNGRVARFAGGAGPGAPTRIAAAEVLARSRASSLVDVADLLSDVVVDDLPSQLRVIRACLSGGLSRSGIVAFGLGGNGVWDTHSANELQGALFEALFAGLGGLVAELADLPGEEAPTLLDETVIAVLSEMGRTPRLTPSGGKDHWTFTSAMLVGGRVRGGRAIGAWQDGMQGGAVDLASGDVDATGTMLSPSHLGATLLSLMDIDPAEFIDPAIATAIEGAIAG
ncbi:MAG: DUF1501 domain-containing protein [Myxococcales bacterium]|nr:DUF1501 domain-containing protein [Myxococcales bacterium]